MPRSLATTCGISVDFSSSPYLDVSVQAVPHVRLFDSTHVDGVLLRRVSPFGNLRIDGYLQLPGAYRSLSRPSSAPDAKAFPLRPFALDLELCRLSLRFGLHCSFTLRSICSGCLPQFLASAFCCLASCFSSSLFSFQGAAFRLFLKPDLNTHSLP